MKTTLAPKFSGPTQRRSRAGLGKGGAGWNPRPRQAGRPVKPQGPPCCHGRWHAPLGFPSPKAKGKGGGRGGVWRRGCMGWIHAPPPLLAAPPKLLLKLDHFSISFGDFSFFL
jgi:hypothetical protein